MLGTCSWELRGKGRSGMVGSFLEHEELARTALSCHLSMDLLWEMQGAWCFEDCWKVGKNVLK